MAHIWMMVGYALRPGRPDGESGCAEVGQCAAWPERLAAFGPGMGGVVDLGQMLEVEMGIDLGRRDACVPKHFLDRPQIPR